MVADELSKDDPRVRRVAHLEEEVRLCPERCGGLVTFGVAGPDLVEFGDRLFLAALLLIAACRPVECIVGERRLLVVCSEGIELRNDACAVLPLRVLRLLVAEQPPERAVLLDDLGPCGIATEREEQHRHAGRTQRHWPRITEWTRRFRAQHGSLSSWQSGNSFP